MIKKTRKISNKLGDIIKLFNERETKPLKEIYISEIKYKKEKGWNYHKKATSKILVIEGEIKFYITKDFKKIKEINLSANDYRYLLIKPKKWFKFIGIKRKNKLMNFTDCIHNKNEIKKKPIN